MANYNGDAGNNSIIGSDAADTIDFSQGGTDTVNAGKGDDTLLGGGTFDANDEINGSFGYDTLNLAGDYSAGLTLNVLTLRFVEKIQFGAGFDYDITTHENTVAAGQVLTIDAYSVSAGKNLVFDGSAETNGGFLFYDGQSNDTLIGGAQYDNFSIGYGGTDTAIGGGGNDVFNVGGELTAADTIDGGTGNDVLYMSGNYGLGLNGTFVTSVENIALLYDFTYNLSTTDSVVAAGQELYVSGWGISGSGKMTFNGFAETDGTFTFTDSINDDVIWGGQNNDDFRPYMGGTDVFVGWGGDDRFAMKAALDATDTVFGGAGNDTLSLEGDYSAGLIFANNTISGIEELYVGAGFDYKLEMADGNVSAGQTLIVRSGYLTGSDQLIFDGSAETDGDFTFLGGSTGEQFTGGGQGDYMDASGGGNDSFFGEGGNDVVNFFGAFTTADFVDGGAGDDHVAISAGYPSLTLGSASLQNVESITFGGDFDFNVTTENSLVAASAELAVDSYFLPADRSLVFNGAAETDGRFHVTGGAGADVLRTGSGDDTLEGRGGDDSLHGGAGDDDLFAGEGDDGMRASAGFDHFDGGAGIDGVNFAQASSSIVFLDGSGVNAGGASGDSFVGVENINGSETGLDFLVGDGAANRFTGNGGNDTLRGGGGIDQLEGGAGQDRLAGGAANDVLVGGADADTFVFADAPAAGGLDRTADFVHLLDKIEIDASMFGGGLVAGGAVQLVANANPSSAGQASGVFLYDTDSGFLSFDADGQGAGAAVAFFRLQNLPTLSAADFVVVA